MIDWYAQAEVGGDVVRISEPHVNELLSANFWWLRGNDRDIVVDAGLGFVALRTAIPAMFERDPLVVLTHAHLDHVGGAPEFGDRAAHSAEAELLAAGYRRACTARSSSTYSGSRQRAKPCRSS